MPRRGQEKPDAESTVKAVQRRFATPVPRGVDLAELNVLFHQRCQAERDRVVQSLFGPFKIGDRFAEEQATAAPLPSIGAAGLVTELEKAQKQYMLDRFLGQLDRTHLLICDEVGYVSMSRGGVERMFRVFARRYERGSVLITTNLPFREWNQRKVQPNQARD
jgi:hypothetical protein